MFRDMKLIVETTAHAEGLTEEGDWVRASESIGMRTIITKTFLEAIIEEGKEDVLVDMFKDSILKLKKRWEEENWFI
jgi:hypothetical protein